MPDDPSNPFDPRIETGSRARELPQEAHIKKRFEKFQDFVDMYRSRISLGGAFIDTAVLRPVGSEVYLDFRLEDGYRLLYGLAEVVWVRLKTMSDERPKGMGLRFLSLDEGGRELVLKLLEEQVKSGGAPFEVDRVPEDGSIDPTVVQAMAGPSAEENEAAQKAKTGSREAQQPLSDDSDDGDFLPDLPPGVLPPPDDEADFSAPWGEQLPEIPDELLEESASGGSSDSSPGFSLPAVEAPESPYAPGSDTHDEVPEAEQAGFAFEPPADGGDPHLDETDFGASAWGAADPPGVKPVGGVTSLQQARANDPFTDFDDESVPEVDGTLFQLPDSAPAKPGPVAAAQADAPTLEAPSFDAPAFDAPSFEAPSFGASEPNVAEAGPSFDGGGFDGGGFDGGGFDGGGFDGGGFDAGSAFDVDFDDDTGSQVAPPPDIGEAVGRAWEEDFDPDGESPPATASQATASPVTAPPASASATSAFRDLDTPPQPTPAESAAMDAAMDIGDDDFAFEPPEADALGVPADASPSPAPSHSPSSTDTADDLFAFRGPADALPALDPEETASLRKGALPDLSETMMGTKAPSPTEGGESLDGSYDDWEEWAPHPAKSGGRTKMVLGVVLLLALVGGASYFFRSTLLPMIGFGGGPSSSASAGPAAAEDATEEGTDDGTDDGIEEYGPQDSASDDPLAEPVEVAEPEPDDSLADFLGSDVSDGTDGSDPETTDAGSEPQTQASAESLRPPSTRRDPPPEPTAQPTPPPPSRDTARPTGRAASHVERIEVRPSAGATEVIIHVDGDVAANRFTLDKLAWAPDREMVTLLGFENFEQTQIAGRGDHLRQVRVGFHPGKELRLVFDLASATVSIQDVQAQGNQVVVRLSN